LQGGAVEYRVLGPLEVHDGQGLLSLAGAKQRTLLALLLVHANRVLSRDRLIDELWGDEPPETVVQNLQVYVSRLRKLLPAETLLTRPPGYLLEIAPDELDLQRFERLLAAGRETLAAGNPDSASAILHEALALWRGPALAEFAFDSFAQGEIGRLEDLRLVAVEERVEADLALGRHAGLIGELQALIAENPHRERLRGQLMLALYRSARQAEALEVYGDARRALVDELGIEPSAALTRLEKQILTHDERLDAPARPQAVTRVPAATTQPAVARDRRKVVTVLVYDITGSPGESSDPESLRALLADCFEQVRAAVERHGGTVEKVVGEAMMAVFGVPRLHEDDALRAVRAAVELRDALPELGIAGGIGVTTGEVVTGTEERLATGSVVRVAARLGQAAQPGEVLIGSETLRLVRDAVVVEAVDPLVLKGRSEPMRAWRLQQLTGGGPRRRSAPMVGRERQLEMLQGSLANARHDLACQLFTILGSAGVGKSRLVAEFLATLDATVVGGRCLSYGDGITYWPVIEALKQVDTRPTDEAAAAVVAGLLGETLQPLTPDEIAWAFRKTLEAAADERSLVCVFDDLHWGEPAFLDLVEHVADFSRDAPILLLCLARPELLEHRAGWAGGKLNATTLLLEPLTPAETDQLIDRLGPEPLNDALRARVRRAAEGNPLFVEELLALVRESGDGDIAVPPTIRALLAARLDQLDPSERAVLERGAVEGQVFHRGTVEALVPEEAQVSERLMSLVRKDLVRPDRTQIPGDDAFRFRHLLIRDAAYDALPKTERAELHQRFAAWLEQQGANVVELDEILGYHLEQACRYRAELGMPDDGALTAAARARLTSAGRRALLRLDMPAAVNFLERAATFVPSGEVEIALELDRVDALFLSGEPREALRLAGVAAERAARAHDRIGELCALIASAELRINVEPEGATDTTLALTDEALPIFEAASDDFAISCAYRARAAAAINRGLFDTALATLETALMHARRTGLPHIEPSVLRLSPPADLRLFGSTPVSELLAWLDDHETSGTHHQEVRASALAMLGEFRSARSILAGRRAETADRGATIALGVEVSQLFVSVELLAGDPEAAVELGREGCRLLEEIGERAFLSTGAGLLAQALYECGELDQADEWVGRAIEFGASDDAWTQMLARQARAKVLARRGEHFEAERLAREAVALGDQTEMLNDSANAYADLAEVLALGGQNADAASALEEAHARYTRKGNVVSARRAQARLDSLAAPSPR
jgi:DNA-binding SARP family transcriptional activator